MPRFVRVFIVIPAAAKNAANTAAANWDDAVTPEEIAASSQTFGGLGYSASGVGPATHYACSTVLAAGMLVRAQAKIANLPPAIKWAILKVPDPSGRLAASNLGVPVNTIYDFEQMLTALNLKRIEE